MFSNILKTLIIIVGVTLVGLFLLGKTRTQLMLESESIDFRPGPDTESASTALPKFAQSETHTTFTPVISVAPKPKQTLRATTKTPLTKPPIQTQALAPQPKIFNTDELYAKYQPAVLNIWCVEGSKATSGTATIINPSGILITNAHVVKDIKDIKNCVLRKANPFDNIAEFEILYIPSQNELIEGTEFPRNDFAILKITKVFDRPAGISWPSVPLGMETPVSGDTLFVFSYGTEFIGFNIAVKGIPLTFSSFKVSEQATVDADLTTAEALILESGLSAQGGSSGGPLVDFNKKIVALMSFVTKGETTASRKGAAILISYMDDIMKKETGLSILEYATAHSTP